MYELIQSNAPMKQMKLQPQVLFLPWTPSKALGGALEMCSHGRVCLHNLNKYDIFNQIWVERLSLSTLSSSLFISPCVTWH